MARFGSEIAELDVHELREYLVTHLREEVEQESIGVIETHRVSGKIFLELDDSDLKEMFPRIGERKAVKRLLEKARQKEKVDDSVKESPSIELEVSKFLLALHYKGFKRQALACIF